MKVIAESKWDWMLYQDSNSYIVSVLCGSVGMYTREIVLSAEEENSYLCRGEIAIDNMADLVRGNLDEYQARHIQGFSSNENVKKALNDWKS